MASNFYWCLNSNCLEISLTERTRTPGMADMQRGLPESSTGIAEMMDSSSNNASEGAERPTKRLKPTIEQRPISLLWEAATRARIWISKEFLLELGVSYRREDTIALLEQAMKSIWEHAPNLTHCSLYAVPHPQSSVEQDDNPQNFYFPMRALTSFLRNMTQLKALDIVGIACFHHSDEELNDFRETLRGHFLQELSVVIDIDSPESNNNNHELEQKHTAWVSSLLGLKNLKQLHMEGVPYLLRQLDCLEDLEAISLSYVRLDVVFEPGQLKSLVDLIASCSNLSHLSVGLAAKGSRNLDHDLAMMKLLSKTIGKSQLDILRIRFDKQLISDSQLQKCWTDMLKDNYSTTQFQIAIYSDFKGRVPEQETEGPVPEQLKADVDAFVKMNAMARKRIFSPYFELETITNEGWTRSLQEICSAELPPELAVSCMYLYMRQRPAEVSNHLLKQYATKSPNESPVLSMAARIGKRKLKTLIQSEIRFYDLTYELVSLRERLANFQRSIIDTSDKRMKALAVVARIKQVSSGPDARDLSPTLARVYEKATQLVVCLEQHNGTIGESLGLFRTGDGLKTLTAELKQLKQLIQTSFTMLEEMGATP